MFTQKYTIVQFFDPVSVGYVYSSGTWPLHSTIIDTFAVNWSVNEMIIKLTELLRSHTPVESIAEDDGFFGENGQVHVTLLRRSENLMNLHLDVVKALKDGGLTLNDPQFAYDGFLPHVTVQKHARLSKGEKVRFTALSIVDMFPNEDAYTRKVLATIKIGSDREV